MKVVYAPRAVDDLVEIADYLRARSLSGAFAVSRRIEDVVDRLAEYPGIGRLLEQRPETRVMPLGRYPYLIFYTSSANELTILHVRHAARRPVEEMEF